MLVIMAIFQLFINGVRVLASPEAGGQSSQSEVSLISLERTYDDPAKLVFRWGVDWRPSPYAADSLVELVRDDVVVFSGLLDLPRPVASVRQHSAIEYTAYDLRRALGFPPAMAAEDNASIRLDTGPLQDVVAAYLEYVGDTLAAYGMDPTIEYQAGAGGIQTLPVSLSAETVDGGFRQIAAAAPGVNLLVNPPAVLGGASRYTFVNVFSSPTHDLVIDQTRVPTLNIQQSIDGRYGAVRTLEGQTSASADTTLTTIRDLVPAWDPDLQDQWRVQHAYAVDGDGAPTELSQVYRRFSFAAFANLIQEDTPMVALVEILPDEVNAVFQRFEIASKDLAAQTVTLNLPAIKGLSHGTGRFSPLEPGRGKPAPVRLHFSESATASAPIIINSARFPAQGYSGRAYGLAPTTCGAEKIITVPAGVNIEDYVRDAHAALSEPVTSGAIPLNDDLPADLWFLNRRINVTTESHGSTGFESLAAPLMGIRVEFAGGISARLDLHRDRSQMLRRGA